MTKIAVIAGTGCGHLFASLQWTGLPEETPFDQRGRRYLIEQSTKRGMAQVE